VIGIFGAGRFSVDALIARRLRQPQPESATIPA
jgi:hypothetical protein